MGKFRSHLKNSNVREWISLMVLLAVSVFSVNYRYETHILFTSLTGLDEHAAFDGTVMPIQEAPDWTHLTSAEYSMSYQELPASKLEPISEYRTDYLTFDSDALVWGNATHDIIRNTKITYPVPYAGSYELNDCGENCGSHPAVDIKVPEGTPVYSIANGIVSEAGTSSGFGKYIVIKHNGAPDPNQPGQTTTLYSSYSHLSEFFVTEGAEVVKGEVIGQVGDTGTATTYHLHFQLDTADAPWHPYWPFTTAEATAAGYDFWDAVSHGVGQDNLYRYTRNPLEFVQAHLDGDATFTSTPIISTVESTITPVEEEAVTEEVTSAVVGIDFTDLEIATPAFIMPGQNQTISISLLDENDEVKEDASFDGEMSVTVSDENSARLNRSSVSTADFDDGVAELSLYADREGSVTVTAEIAGREYYSSVVYVIATIEPFAKFGVAHDGYFVPGKAETIQIQAQDLNGNPTPGFYGDGPVELSLVEGSGTFSKDSLGREDLSTGIAEVEFTADSEGDVIIQVTYGTKVIESSTLESRLFNDISEVHEFYTAVSYLVQKGTVQGYPDGTFKPDNTVSRVEALKFIFSGLDQNVSTGLTAHYSDTQSGEWYSDYLATASSIGVVQGYSDGSFKPTQGVNRVEFLKMIFSTVDVSIDPVVTEDPYEDVNNLSWYAPYVQYAKEKNLFPVSGQYFNPGDPMSRVEVAEVIYRMITVNQNDGESYNSLMKTE
ncbi:MAG: S-layer homology domain-containing protein [Candidatus Gracilibacteria bacterium]